MRIFKDKNGTIYIVAGVKEKAPRVVIAKDDGIANYECEYLLREYDNAIRFLPRNYKKTWWLKADKSE